MNFRLAREQVVHLETAANLCASPRQEIIQVFAVMAAEHFQTRIEDRDRAGGGAGGGEGGFSPPTFVLYKIKIKESSNKIAEEISLVRNGVKISKNRRRHSRHKE